MHDGPGMYANKPTWRGPSRWVPLTLLWGGVAAAAAGALTTVPAPPVPSPVVAADHVVDFDALVDGIARNYAYLDPRRTDLAEARTRLRPLAAAARDRSELIRVLEQALESLADGHATLHTNVPGSTRLIPSGLDVWAELHNGQAVVTQVRRGWPAARAGVAPGDIIMAVNGVALATALERRLPCCSDRAAPETRAYALLALLAGTHDQPRRLRLRRGEAEREVALENPDEQPATPAVSYERLGRLGYIALRHVGDPASVPSFDLALAALRDTDGLILDLRDTAAGGDTSVAEPILGRLLRARRPYQRIVPRSGTPWLRQVSPRGPWTYEQPVAVLVGRWTGSMGEGMAIGLDGLGRATVIGGPMAGLLGAVYTYTLPRSRIPYNLPGDRLTHVDGTPREAFVPKILVADPPSGEDVVLTRARTLLETRRRHNLSRY